MGNNYKANEKVYSDGLVGMGIKKQRYVLVVGFSRRNCPWETRHELSTHLGNGLQIVMFSCFWEGRKGLK